MKTFNLEKVQAYSGSVLKDLRLPDNYRSFSASCRKIIKLYLRMHRDQIFYPELIQAVKDASRALRFIGVSKYHDKTPDNLIAFLEKIMTDNIDRWLEVKQYLVASDERIVVEESRERKLGTHCSFCRVELKYPSFVVRRNEKEVLHRSLPIGVMCLHSSQKRLNKFLNSPQIVAALEEIKQVTVLV